MLVYPAPPTKGDSNDHRRKHLSHESKWDRHRRFKRVIVYLVSIALVTVSTADAGAGENNG